MCQTTDSPTPATKVFWGKSWWINVLGYEWLNLTEDGAHWNEFVSDCIASELSYHTEAEGSWTWFWACEKLLCLTPTIPHSGFKGTPLPEPKTCSLPNKPVFVSGASPKRKTKSWFVGRILFPVPFLLEIVLEKTKANKCSPCPECHSYRYKCAEEFLPWIDLIQLID